MWPSAFPLMVSNGRIREGAFVDAPRQGLSRARRSTTGVSGPVRGKLKILVLVVVILVGGTVAAVWQVRSMRREAVRAALQDLAAQADAWRVTVATRVRSLEEDLALLLASDPLDPLPTSSAGRGFSTTELVQSLRGYARVELRDGEGRVVGATGDPQLATLTDDAWRGILGEGSGAGWLDHRFVSGGAYLVVGRSEPVPGGDGALRGAVIAVSTGRWLFPAALYGAERYESGTFSAYIESDGGVTRLRAGPRFGGAPVSEAVSAPPWLAEPIPGEGAEGVLAGEDGESVVAVVRPVPETSWTLVRSVSEAEVLGGPRERLLLDLSAQALFLLLLMVSLSLRRRVLAAQALVEENLRLEREVRARTAQVEASRARIQEMNDDLRAFTHNVAHDLKAPLRAIDLLAGRLGDTMVREGSGVAVLGALEEIHDRVHRANELIDALLRLSRASYRPLRSQDVSLRVVLEAARESVEGPGQEGGVEWVVGAMPTVRGDSVLLQQAFENLLSNAVKFQRPGATPRIEVNAVEGAGEVVIRVRDNGVGCDMRFARKLFQPFQRLHHYEEYPGSGVGLAIVARVASRHGGRVWLDSVPGEGTTVFLALPIDRTSDPRVAP